MASKSKRPKLSLPDPRQLMLQRKEQQGIVKTVEGAIHILENSNLTQLSESAQQSVSESTKVAWLVAKYGLEQVHILCQAIKNTPSVLTHHQRLELINAQATSCKFLASELEQLVGYIENQCPGLINSQQDADESPVILAPPVRCCYECNQELVAYHSCKVRYFTCTGAVDATKVTLRCVHCRLHYNYAQFGNKHDRGFQYYPVSRPAVECTDGQIMERRLLEFQCCLA